MKLYFFVSTEICPCREGHILKAKSCLKIKKLNQECDEATDFCIQKFSICEDICICAKGFSQVDNICTMRKLKENSQLTKIFTHNSKFKIQQKPSALESKANVANIELIIVFLVIFLTILIAIIVMTHAKSNQNYPVNSENAFFRNIIPNAL